MQEAGGYQRRAVFSLEAASPAVCLLVQLEKHVTEEGGVTPSVYTRKEPVSVPQELFEMELFDITFLIPLQW
jgi:hypothetical protein